jgi:8-oxo-dGTP pyrophosphatase MutT (NUDIX family)
VLLLLRAGNHNANTWGLPGGNADATDRDLLETATREAEEEMGPLPPLRVLGSILTK